MTPAQEILHHHGGAVRSSDWNTGHPEYRRRKIPDGFRFYAARDVRLVPQPYRAKAESILRAYPRTRWIIAPRTSPTQS